jgi:dihydroorotate dehydrogenase
MYQLTRPLLFQLDPERAHDLTMGAVALSSRSPGALRLLRSVYAVRDPRLEVRAFGLDFPNPVGFAAGLVKNAVAIPAFEALGFGAGEIGSVTA